MEPIGTGQPRGQDGRHCSSTRPTKDRDFKRVFDAYLQQTDDTAHYAIEAERNAPDIPCAWTTWFDAAKGPVAPGPKHKRDLEAVSRALFANIEGQTGVQSVRYDELSLRQIHASTIARSPCTTRRARRWTPASSGWLQTYAAQIGAANGLSIDELKNMALDDTVAMVKTHIQETRRPARRRELRREVMAQDQDEALDRARQLGGFRRRHGRRDAHAARPAGQDRRRPASSRSRLHAGDALRRIRRDGDRPETNETLHFEMFESQTAANLAAMPAPGVPDGMIEVGDEPGSSTACSGGEPETVELFAQFTGADQSRPTSATSRWPRARAT